MENNILAEAIQSVQNSEVAFSKFITANDVGTTGAHQAGFHIHKNAWPLLFNSPGQKGENKDKYVTIKWQNNFETQSRFIYYGVNTRNEYRLTRFGRGFPYLHDENIGDLLIITKQSEEFYDAFVLHHDDEIDGFLAALNISTTEINGLISKQIEETAEDKIIECFNAYISSLNVNFPTTIELATNARNCYNSSFSVTPKLIKENPDKELLQWINSEFQLFKTLENNRYSERIKSPFTSVEELVEIANTILNRRKSRAGKSLEHHLAEIFNIFNLHYETQAVTEINKKPDFLFPNIEAYKNPCYDESKLIVLAAKTTCKDRWRQILNEADRIRIKHLFTLQQGISKNQLEEMYKYNVNLVVPKPYLESFPKEFRSKISTLDSFVKKVRSYQI